MPKQIKITFDTAGRATIDAEGYNGVGCRDAVNAFAKVLGQAGQGTEKPEMWQPDLDQQAEQL